jgi:hypothetical protein
VLVGGILVMVGLLILAALIGSEGPGTSLSSLQLDQETAYSLVGVGFFVVILGWVVHQARSARWR